MERIVDAVDAEDVHRATEIGWVVRRFDDDLLSYLMAEMDSESSGTPVEPSNEQLADESIYIDQLVHLLEDITVDIEVME